MTKTFSTVVLAVLALTAGWASAADRVILVGGGEVVGEILKSDDEVVIVDLGQAVLRLDRAKVLRIEAGKDEAADEPAEDAGEPDDADAEALYRTGELKPVTIEKNVERFGEAVVMVQTPRGMGSGFVINSDGHLITNYHVIADETRIKVTVFHKSKQGFEPKHYKKVRIVAINPFVDLALLKIEQEGTDADGETPAGEKATKGEKDAPRKFLHAYLGTMSDVVAGQRCFAIGNPLGLSRTVSQGIVSTKNRNFEGRLYIQTTTDINPGNSGGPLFNYNGEVIGVTSMGYMFMGGLNFAIPVDVVKRFIENREAFAYDEDNPNSGFRYLQPAGREAPGKPPEARLPDLDAAS